jgi:fructokinase
MTAEVRAAFRFGVDLGGTKIEGVILDAERKVTFRERMATEQEGGYRHILNNISTLYGRMTRAVAGAAHTFGIGTPGAISTQTGLMKNSNTLCLNGQPLLQDLRALLGRDLDIQNDANCFAQAEATLGAGTGKQMVFGVIMGTGCGGGIVYEGKVITGPQAIAGEWGHMSIDPNGPACYCGSSGCVETFISGGGLEARYQRETGQTATLKQIVARYRRREAEIQDFMHTFFTDFGRSMANLINVLDPDIIVLGGGVSNIDELYSDGKREVERFIFNDRCDTPIVKHQLGDSAGVLGAALIGK